MKFSCPVFILLLSFLLCTEHQQVSAKLVRGEMAASNDNVLSVNRQLEEHEGIMHNKNKKARGNRLRNRKGKKKARNGGKTGEFEGFFGKEGGNHEHQEMILRRNGGKKGVGENPAWRKFLNKNGIGGAEEFLRKNPDYLENHPEVSEFLENSPDFLENHPRIKRQQGMHKKHSPGYLENNPEESEFFENHPDLLEHHPGFLENRPDFLENHPRIKRQQGMHKKHSPGYLENNPEESEFLENHPDFLEDRPDFLEDRPDFLEDHPGIKRQQGMHKKHPH